MTGRSLWPAPAKLNLFLHVTGRRADVYHELQTVFQLIDLCDTIGLTVREDGVIERPDGPAGVDPESDLTVRAARALQRAADGGGDSPGAGATRGVGGGVRTLGEGSGARARGAAPLGATLR